jgi:signal transduction histidine kinase
MTFRVRLILLVALTVAVTVTLAIWAVSSFTERAFGELDDQRTKALVAQFRREFARRGEEVVRTAEAVAASESTLRMVVETRRRQPDYSPYVQEAGALAVAQRLDFLEIVAGEGSIISSAQFAARFGYKADWLLQSTGWQKTGAFLKREELPGEMALALTAVREVMAGDRKLYVVAGRRLDKEFLGSLVLPAGMRVLLYRNFTASFAQDSLTDPLGAVAGASTLEGLIEEVRTHKREVSRTIQWPDGPETFQAIPLTGREGDLLGVLLAGSSRRELAALIRRIRMAGLAVGGAGLLLGIVLSYWVTARITRPVDQLATGAREVAAGNWEARVDVRSHDEIGELAEAFNRMTGQLIEQRDRLVQTERVAAWRELARRLAHELKNPLFPLQITVENLQRARAQAPDQFDEIFRESTATLLAELSNLKTIIGRFSEFAKMPPPQFESVALNELVRENLRLFDAQLRGGARPRIHTEADLDESLAKISADSGQLSRALQNLTLNAIDAMPAGGTLRFRTRRVEGGVTLEVSDSGEGLTKEECERLFTPYYTTKQHGTGLGLAIVQSVVSDHNGRITVESEQGRGTTFRIELPNASENDLAPEPS